MAITINGTTGIAGVDGSASTPAYQGADTNTGIAFPAADTVAVATGGSERIRVDSNGNVGIGTSSPATALCLGNSKTLSWLNSSGNLNGTTTGTQILKFSDNNLYIDNLDSSTNIIFRRNGPTESMRIDSSGNLLVGTTSVPSAAGVSGSNAFVRSAADATWTLMAQNTATSGGARGIIVNYSGQTPNSTTSEAYFFYDSTGTKFAVRSNGGIANFSANNVNLSDRREKTNFAPAKNYLDVICSIPVQTFNYIGQNLVEDDGLTLGVVAQDVQSVAPELVMESNWGTDEEPKMRLSIYQTDLQYALMKAIQELNAKVEAQAAEIAALKGTNNV